MITELIDNVLYRLALAVSRKARRTKAELEHARFNLAEAYNDLDSMGKIVDELLYGYEIPASLVEIQDIKIHE